MPKYSIPAIEEDEGSRNIEGVPTSIAGFIGLTNNGPVNEPVLIQSFAEFEGTFGSYWDGGQLAYSVAGFFENGGRRCLIVRINDSEDVSEITEGQFIGTAEEKSGLHAFKEQDAVKLIAIPDAHGSAIVTKAGLAYCAEKRNCFFIVDAPKGKSPDEMKVYIEENNFDSSYGAIYYPNIYVETLDGEQRLVHPSGHIAGYYAKIDETRGVWKAPAGRERELLGAVNLEIEVPQEKQQILNPLGVNVIRWFPEIGIVPWGARSLSPESEFKYLNVRRFYNYIEESVSKGTRWVVFEPNDEALWAKIRNILRSFLEGVWRSGALQGAKPQDAFFVKCDRETNPPSSIEAGELHIEIGLAVLKPAEFILLKIAHKMYAPKGDNSKPASRPQIRKDR